MYRVELKGKYTASYSNKPFLRFLMYRVELKDVWVLGANADFPHEEFLMYRVELKAPIGGVGKKLNLRS